MSRKKVIYNVIASFITQIISIIVALLVPRLLILIYGSEINGLVSSINQIVRYFAIMESGVCAAACASLFKPLLDQDYERVNRIFSSVNKFYLKFGVFILGISVILSFIYPIKLMGTSDYITGVLIVFITSLTSVLGYLSYLKYNLVLFVNGKQYITILSASLVNLIVAIVQVILIKLNINILIVVSINPILNIIRLMLLKFYVIKKYTYLNFKTTLDDEALSQKWDALAINISQMLKVVIPIMYLNIFFDFNAISVYTLYASIFHVGSSIISTMGNGLTPFMGNLYAAGKMDKINTYYKFSTNCIFMFVAIISIGFGTLLFSFIDYVYIGTSTDISYYAPMLAISFIVNEAIINLRFAPEILIKASGKLKQTSKSLIVEIILALVITPVGCYIFGYEGVLIGSIISSLYRTIYISWYCRKQIIKTDFKDIIKNFFYIFYVITAIIVVNYINIDMSTTIKWILAAVSIVTINSVIIFISNIVIIDRKFKQNMKYFLKNRRGHE